MSAKLEILFATVAILVKKLLDWVEDLFKLKSNDEAKIYSQVGQKHADRGNLDDAISSLKKALELDPQDKEASFKLARSCAKKGLLDDAVVYYRKALGGRRDAEIHYHLGLIYSRKKNVNFAIDAYSKSIELGPEMPDAYFRLALILDGQKNHKDAIGLYEKAIALNPDESKYYYSCGLAYDADNQHEKAIECFRKAMETEEA